jgi:isocitrate dehydrogenase kinase/phosphatase
MAHRAAYDAAYYQANKARLRASRRLNMRAYRRRHSVAIKVARILKVPIAKARLMLERQA